MKGQLFFSLIRPMFQLLATSSPVAYAIVRAAPTLVSSLRLLAATLRPPLIIQRGGLFLDLLAPA